MILKEGRREMESWEDKLNKAMAEKGYTDSSEFTLDELLELAKGHVMTPHEREQQRISFAVGMLPFADTTTTREDIERAAKENPTSHLKVVR